MIKQYVRGFDIDKFKPETLEHLYDKLIINFCNCKYKITTDLMPIQKDIRIIKEVDLQFNNNDCCISHFGHNFYIRTQKQYKVRDIKHLKLH